MQAAVQSMSLTQWSWNWSSVWRRLGGAVTVVGATVQEGLLVVHSGKGYRVNHSG